MLREEIKAISSGPRELRQFALVIGIALAIFGALGAWRGRSYPPYLFIVAALLFLLGLFRPSALRPLHKAWMTLAVVLGWIVSRLILGALFYVVVTPIGLLAKLAGKRFLQVAFRDRNAVSYWIPKSPAGDVRERLEKQF